MDQPRRGLFVAFEGGEGAGKSSTIRTVAGKLREIDRDRPVIETREPGGSPLAETIRALLVSSRPQPMPDRVEAMLFAAARADHVDSLIRPQLARGAIVLTDRFSLSTLAYQGAGRGVDNQVLATVDAIARDGLEPDLTIILDVDARTGLRRSMRRTSDADHFELLGVEFHERVRQAFLAFGREKRDQRIVLDASLEPTIVANLALTAILIAQGKLKEMAA